MAKVALAICLTSLLAAGGCGRSKWPALARLEGRVTLDGRPLGDKFLGFTPEINVRELGTLEPSSIAVTREDGTYSASTVRPGGLRLEPGIVAGAYVVTVNDRGTQAPSAHSTIPAPYRVSRTSTLRVEVPAKGGKADLNLESRP